MAAGDVIYAIANIGAGARLTYRPAVGSEAMINCVGSDTFVGLAPDPSPQVTLEMTNGVINSSIAIDNNAPYFWIFLKVYITNTIWVTVLNNAIGAAVLVVSGLETK